VTEAAFRILHPGREAEAAAGLDRGLQYGDGLFETITLRAGAAPLLARHIARLRRGCRRLGLPVPDPSLLEREIARAAPAGGSGIVKLVLTRGAGGRGYRPAGAGPANLYLSWHPPARLPEHPAEAGVVLALCATPIGLSPATAGMKHLNRLEQVLASAELGARYYEGLMCDPMDRLIEGTRSNVFVGFGARLVTPALAGAGVAGIMREWLLERLQAGGRQCEEGELPLAALAGASELFVCNSAIGVWPVIRLEGRAAWSGQPGPAAAYCLAQCRAAGLQAP